MKPLHLWITAAAILLTAFLLSQDMLARIAWQRFNRPDIALVLIRRDAKLALELGNYYFNGGAYDLGAAERAFLQALAIDPNVKRAHYQISRIRFLRGHFIKALEEVNQEMRMHPEIPNSYYVRGLINGYMGHFAEAETDFSKFVELVPLQWAGYNDLVWILAKRGKFQEAKDVILAAFDKLPGEKTRNPWLWTSLGVASLNLKDYNYARDAFLKALTITNTMSPQYFWSAYPGNDPRDAEMAWQRFRGTLHFNLGVTHEKLKEYSRAKVAYQTYLSSLTGEAREEKKGVEKKLSELNFQK